MKSLIRPALNLALRHFERTHHGIICIGTWLTHDDDRGRTEPCLVLLHGARPIAAGRTVPIVIPLSEFWRYAVSEDKSIGDPVHAGLRINEWLGAGLLPGNPHNPKDHFKVLDAINECLRDLVHMPPKPKTESYAIGDITITNRLTGKAIAEREITNDT